MSKHTPGPWRMGTDVSGRNYNANMIQCGPEDFTADSVACVYGVPQNRGIHELQSDERWATGIANARLIAAAPEMYEALKEAAMHIALIRGGDKALLAELDALLAKIEGE